MSAFTGCLCSSVLPQSLISFYVLGAYILLHHVGERECGVRGGIVTWLLRLKTGSSVPAAGTCSVRIFTSAMEYVHLC